MAHQNEVLVEIGEKMVNQELMENQEEEELPEKPDWMDEEDSPENKA